MAENDKWYRRRPAPSQTNKPRLSAFKNDAVTQAVVSKLVEPLVPIVRKANDTGDMNAPDPSLVFGLTDKTATNITDSANMMQVLPDLSLAKQVLIATILSPNDLMEGDLKIATTDNKLGDMNAPLIKVIQDYFKVDYKIDRLLPKILEDVLFMTGSYPMAIVPESSIDDIINSNQRVTMESMVGEFDKNGNVRPLGLLGNSTSNISSDLKPAQARLGMEDFTRKNTYLKTTVDPVINQYTSVLDNPNVLKHPVLLSKTINDRVSGVYAVNKLGLEANEKMKPEELNQFAFRNMMFKRRQYRHVPVVEMKPLDMLDKPTVGHPLVLNLPAESVIPVHVPGNPDEHVGYFILLDQTGNPVAKAAQSDYYNDIVSKMRQNKELSSQLLSVTNRSMHGTTADYQQNIDAMTNAYTDVIEKNLLSRLKNGAYGDTVAVARPREVYRIMLARALSRMYTQLLYVPATNMCYIAFDYNRYGVGESLLEKTKIIGSMRAMLMFANTMAAVKNSINKTELKITLDENDPDPDGTIEKIVHEYSKTRQATFPIGASHPLDLVHYIQMAAVGVTVDGHPGYPTTKLEIAEHANQRIVPSTELEDNLRKRQLFGINVPPETVDLSMNVDFAQSVIQSNILMAKRAKIWSDQLCDAITEFIQKYTMNSSELMERLVKVISEQKDLITKLQQKNKDITPERIAVHFLSSVTVELPKPDMTQIDMQLQAFDAYSQALDKIIPAFLSTDMYDATFVGDLSGAIEPTVKLIKAHFQRAWLRKNNVMPEMFDLLSFNDEDKAMNDFLKKHEEHIANLSKTMMPFLKKVLEAIQKRNEVIQQAGGLNAAPASSGGGEGGGEGGGDEFSDLPDFGGAADEATGQADLENESAAAGKEAGTTDEAGKETPPEDKGTKETPKDEEKNKDTGKEEKK